MGSVCYVSVNRSVGMKRAIKIILPVLFIVILSILIISMVGKANSQKEALARISTLPDFSMKMLSGETFHTSQIDKGPVLIVHFHPECDYCKEELSEIISSDIPEMTEYILLVSSAHAESVKAMFSGFCPELNNNLIALVDTSYLFIRLFEGAVVPSNYIYNNELRLLKLIKGKVRTETILQLLRQDGSD